MSVTSSEDVEEISDYRGNNQVFRIPTSNYSQPSRILKTKEKGRQKLFYSEFE